MRETDDRLICAELVFEYHINIDIESAGRSGSPSQSVTYFSQYKQQGSQSDNTYKSYSLMTFSFSHLSRDAC